MFWIDRTVRGKRVLIARLGHGIHALATSYKCGVGYGMLFRMTRFC